MSEVVASSAGDIGRSPLGRSGGSSVPRSSGGQEPPAPGTCSASRASSPSKAALPWRARPASSTRVPPGPAGTARTQTRRRVTYSDGTSPSSSRAAATATTGTPGSRARVKTLYCLRSVNDTTMPLASFLGLAGDQQHRPVPERLQPGPVEGEHALGPVGLEVALVGEHHQHRPDQPGVVAERRPARAVGGGDQAGEHGQLQADLGAGPGDLDRPGRPLRGRVAQGQDLLGGQQLLAVALSRTPTTGT